MKKTCLFSAAILLSIASFAQTTVKNQQTANSASAIRTERGNSEVNSSGSASSSTSIRSNAVSDSKKNAHATAEKSQNEVAVTKQEAIAKAKTEKNEAKEDASNNVTVVANGESNTRINAGEQDNKTEGNASLSKGAAVSAAAIANNGNEMKGAVNGTTITGTDLAITKITQAKAGSGKAAIKTGQIVHTGAGTTVKTGAAATHAIKPNPASLKVNSRVKANGGIRIR